MKIKPLLLTALLAVSFSFGGCSEDDPGSGNAGSSSVPEIVDDESAFMKAAPAYDTEKAKTYISAMPEIRELLTSAKAGKDLTSFGSTRAPEAAVKKVKDEIDKLTAGGHKVSLVMVDLEKKSGVAYDPDIPMCTQSTVKAVYLGSVLDSHPEAYEEHRIDFRKAIVNSNNDSYMGLYDTYGKEPLEKWCDEAGVDKAFAASNFPRAYSAKDMIKLWTKLYCFLNSDEMQHSEFASYFADSACSATKMMLCDKYPVQTKAGWESGKDTWKNYDPRDSVQEKYCDGDPSNDECAINDTGIVYTGNGPYLFVIYTDISFGVYYDYVDPNPLYDLAVALNELQAGLHGSSTDTSKPDADSSSTDSSKPDADSSSKDETDTSSASARDILSPRERLGDEPADSPDWVKALPQAAEADQMFVAAGYDKSSAWISFHEKDEKGSWKQLMSTPGFTGLDGIGQASEQVCRTPQGVYGFNCAFGIADDPGCAIPYYKADENTYWSSDDREGMRYNQLIKDIKEVPGIDLEKCEHIYDYMYQYQYCLNISYNEEGKPGAGSAFFVHCIGEKTPYTGGCVAISEDCMRYLMKHVKSDCVVIIDKMDALGAKF